MLPGPGNRLRKDYLILPGDIGKEVENDVAQRFESDASVLLVSPHHGSGRSNGAKLLDALRPGALIFSCGYDNQFGFPAPGAVQRCAERNIPMYRTDLQGAVHAASDGRQWTITHESRAEGRESQVTGHGSDASTRSTANLIKDFIGNRGGRP